MAEFCTEGFDLDAVASSSEGDEVVYELGGGATVASNNAPAAKSTNNNESSVEPEAAAMTEADSLKKQGNDFFKNGSYEEAHDMYSKAIDACPDALSAEEILRQRDEFEEAERAKAVSRQRLRQEELQKAPKEGKKGGTEEEFQKPSKFKLPEQPNGEKLAVFYCNKAAALIQMDKFEEAIKDCDVAILLNPSYVKAYVRRSSAHEKSESTELALEDAKFALSLDPSNAALKKSVARLKKIEDERLEKLKEETMGKLKDLGNSLLGNFGLSLDNFQAVKDPNSGSYSISFNQN